MSSTRLELDLRGALLNTGLVQPISATSKRRWAGVELLCRLVPGQERPWLGVVQQVLEKADEAGLNHLIARRYLLKDKRMVFGWHIAFDAKNLAVLKTGLDSIIEVLNKAKPELTLMEDDQDEQEQQYQSEGTVAHVPPSRPNYKRQKPSIGQHTLARATPAQKPPGPKLQHSVGFDESGNKREEWTMPLPHVTGPMNVPNAKGRGVLRPGEKPKILGG